MKRIWVQMRNNHDKIRRNVVAISTEIMMLSMPGFAVCTLENGGTYIDDDGEFVDAIDVLTPNDNSANIDVTNGDGDKGRRGVASAEETDEDELNRLIDEQNADQSAATFVRRRASDDEDEDDDGIYVDHTDFSNIKIKDGDYYLGSGSRKHSDRGRNDHYKCLRNRGAGTKQQRFQD